MADPQDLVTQMLQGIYAARAANPPPSKEERQGALQGYANAIRTAGKDTRAPYEVMMEGIVTSPNMLDPQVAAPNMFQHLANWRNTQRESEFKRETLAAKAMYDDMNARTKEWMSAGVMSGLKGAGAAASGSWKNVNGVPGLLINDKTSAQLDLRDAANQNTLRQLFLKMREQYPDDDTAMQAALHALSRSQQVNPLVGGLPPANARTVPPAGAVPAPASASPLTAAPTLANQAARPLANQMPAGRTAPNIGDTVTAPAGEAPESASIDLTDLKDVVALIRSAKISPEQAQLLQGALGAYQKDPSAQTKAALEGAINQVYNVQLPSSAYQAAPSTAPAQLAAKPAAPAGFPERTNLQEKARKEHYGAKSGDLQATEARDIHLSGAAARNLMGRLNLMEELTLQHGEAIPEGLLGGVVQDIKSSMQSLGIPTASVGAGDVINALGTYGALESRTAEGTNLLPGAMSNYEDQLLQKVFPGLKFTREGRLLQIQIAKAQMQMKVGLAKEARKYIKAHGSLDAGWDEVADAYAEKNNPFLNEKRIAALLEYTERIKPKKGK